MRGAGAWCLAGMLALGCKGKESGNHGPGPTATTSVGALPLPSPTTSTSARASATLVDASAGDGDVAKRPGVPVLAATKASSFCAIFGTYPANARDGAEGGRARLAKDGIEGLEVRATSDFSELAWGMLVVVSVANTRDGAEAIRRKGSAPSKAFVKPCTELSGSFTVSKEPAEKRVDGDSTGCVGWNPQKKSAVCIESDGSLQRGYNDTVKFLGKTTESEFTWQKIAPREFDAKVDPKAVQKLKTALQKGDYRSLSDYRVREIGPGEVATWAAPAFSIRYDRTKRPDVSTMSGSWNDVSDSILLECGGKKIPLFSDDIQGADEQALRLYWHGESGSVLTSWRVHFGLEGDNGTLERAKWLDIASLCAGP